MHPMYFDGLESKSNIVEASAPMSYNELIKKASALGHIDQNEPI
jgi:hypothetical protein